MFLVIMRKERREKTRYVPRDFCKVRLAGALVSTKFICLHSDERKERDLVRMP